jgi:hypothetical protein
MIAVVEVQVRALVRGHRGGVGHEFAGAEGLEFHGVGARVRGGVDERTREVGVAVVVHARLGDDEAGMAGPDRALTRVRLECDRLGAGFGGQDRARGFEVGVGVDIDGAVGGDRDAGGDAGDAEGPARAQELGRAAVAADGAVDRAVRLTPGRVEVGGGPDHAGVVERERPVDRVIEFRDERSAGVAWIIN